MDKNVKWAVVPVAGKGTRFLPITKGVSKEMLNLVDRPTIDYIVDELILSGIENIVFVTSKGKDDIKKYYDRDENYEKDLVSNHKENFAEDIKKIATKANFYYVLQKEQLGLGHAVLQAEEIIKDNNFVVCCGDDICTYDEELPTKELINQFVKIGNKTVVGGQIVPHTEINKYGAMDIDTKINDKCFKLKGIVEKPLLESAPSDYASLGKWVFNKNIFEALKNTPRGKGNEIQLTDAIALLMKTEDVYYATFSAKRYDCGDKFGYVKAIIDFSLKRDDIGEKVKDYIKTLKL